MKVKFKKRFKSLARYTEFCYLYLSVHNNIRMSAAFHKSYSKGLGKMYYNIEGWYERQPKGDK